MKLKNLKLLAAVFISTVVLFSTACSNPFSGEKGSVAIALNSSMFDGSRAVTDGQGTELMEETSKYSYVISFTGDYEGIFEGPIYEKKTTVKVVDNLEIRSVINIELKILEEGSVKYSGKKEGIVVRPGTNVVSMKLSSGNSGEISTPIVLWNSADGEYHIIPGAGADSSINTGSANGETALVKGLQFVESVPEGFLLSENTVVAENSVLRCFCFDPLTGDFYGIIHRAGANGSILIKMSAAKGYKEIDDSWAIGYFSGHSMVYLDGDIYYLPETSLDSSGNIQKLILDEENDDGSAEVICESSGNFSDYYKNSLATDGKYLYLSWNYNYSSSISIYKKSEPPAEYTSNGEFKGTYFSQVIEKELFFGFDDDSIGVRTMALGNACFCITDMQIKGNTIYALLFDHSSDNACRGGLIQLTWENNSIDFADILPGQKVAGFYNPDNGQLSGDDLSPLKYSETVFNNILYGPRRFIAIKPDELIISDEGFYKSNNNNRVAKFNLLNRTGISSVGVGVSLSHYLAENGSFYTYE